LIPCFVVNLGKSVGVADELTSGPLGKLAVVPREISRCVVFLGVLERSEVKDSPGCD